MNINHEKMSKSLGNFLMIKDVLASYHPEVVRLFLLSNHYRSPIDFSEQNMKEAASGLDRIYGLLERLQDEVFAGEQSADAVPDEYWDRFCDAMDDDFNTALGIGSLFEAIHGTNRMLDELRNGTDPAARLSLARRQASIRRIGQTLGMMSDDPHRYFSRQRTQVLAKESVDSVQVEGMIEERRVARHAKDWATADRIRKVLDEMNIVLEDRPDGTIWRVKT